MTQSLGLAHTNPTSFAANPDRLKMSGSITFCADVPNISIDVRYEYEGAVHEAHGIPLDYDGCITIYYDVPSTAGYYLFTGIRNSVNPYGPWEDIGTAVMLCAPDSNDIHYFFASPDQINRGESALLSWGVGWGAYAYLGGQYLGEGSGQLWVYPTTNTTYTLIAYNDCGSVPGRATASVTVHNPVDSAAYEGMEDFTVQPGQMFNVTIYMRNTGTTTWIPSEYRLEVVPGMNYWGVQYVNLAQEVAPGRMAVFNFNATAPPNEQTYDFQWQMCNVYAQCFDEPTALIPVGVYRQPTFMNFSPSAQNAGNGSYVLTVGNGANMLLDLEYTWSGTGSQKLYAYGWGPLDSQGRIAVDVGHCDNQGHYTFTAVRNSATSPNGRWTQLDGVQFDLRGPQPFAYSLSIEPDDVNLITTPPGSPAQEAVYTMKVRNGGNVTMNTAFSINGVTQPDDIGWPSFAPDPYGPSGTCPGGTPIDGVVDVRVKTCAAVGVYRYTAMGNTNESQWVPQDASVRLACPGAPQILSLSPIQFSAGVDTQIVITGANLCNVSQLFSSQPVTFSNVRPGYDPDAGVTLLATARASQNISVDTSRITFVAPCAVSTYSARFESQPAISPMSPGQTKPVSLTVRNVGNVAWMPSDSVRLGFQATPSSNWQYVPLTVSASVAPGATAAFDFTITAPQTGGSYNLRWQMQVGDNWIGQPVDVAVLVGYENDAVPDSHTVPSSMTAGSGYSVTVKFKNTGTRTWTATDKLVLSSTPSSNWGFAPVSIAAPVPPNAVATFAFNLTAPATPASYSLQWRMQAGEMPFGQPLNVAVNVLLENNASPEGHTIPATMIPGAIHAVTVSFRNTGTRTWTTSDKLGVIPTPSSNWGFAPVSVASPVPPNAVATFAFNLTAPATPASYSLQWRMQAGELPFGQTATTPVLVDLPPISAIPAKEYIYMGNRLFVIEEPIWQGGGMEPQIASAKVVQDEGGARLLIAGSNFTEDAIIRINGADRKTDFFNSRELGAILTVEDAKQDLDIIVVAPGERPSNKASSKLR